MSMIDRLIAIKNVRPWLILAVATMCCVTLSILLLSNGDASAPAITTIHISNSTTISRTISRLQSQIGPVTVTTSTIKHSELLVSEEDDEEAEHSSYQSTTTTINTAKQLHRIKLDSRNQRSCLNEFLQNDAFSFWLGIIREKVQTLNEHNRTQSITNSTTCNQSITKSTTFNQSITNSTIFTSRNGYNLTIPPIELVIDEIRDSAYKRFSDTSMSVSQLLYPARLTVWDRDAIVFERIKNDTKFIDSLRQALIDSKRDWKDGDVHEWLENYTADFQSIDDTVETFTFSFPMLKSPLQMAKESRGERLIDLADKVPDITLIDPELDAEMLASMLLVPSFTNVAHVPPAILDAINQSVNATNRDLFGSAIDARFSPLETRPTVRYDVDDGAHLCALTIVPYSSDLRRTPNERVPEPWDQHFGSDSFLVNFRTVQPPKQSINALTNQSINASTNQSVSASTNQSVSATTNQSVRAATNQSINASADQSVDESASQSINAPIDQSVDVSPPSLDSMKPRQAVTYDNDRWRHLTESEVTDARFSRLIKFKPAQQPAESYSVNFPYLAPLFIQAGWTIDQLQPFHITVDRQPEILAIPVTVSTSDGTNVTVTVKVPAITRAILRIIPAVSLDLGASLYVADVRLPKLRSAISQPIHFGLEGYHEYRNFEWAAEVHHTWLRPQVTPIKLMNSYELVLKSTNQVRVARLPLCEGSDNTGFYASRDSPFVAGHEFSHFEFPHMIVDNLNQSFYAEHCDYHYYTSSEIIQCMNDRYPEVHWFGDSNSRRSIRHLYTAGAWGQQILNLEASDNLKLDTFKPQMTSATGWRQKLLTEYDNAYKGLHEERDLICEDNLDRAIAGALGFDQLTEYPYPMSQQESEVCFFYQNHNALYLSTHLALPKKWGDPYRCFGNQSISQSVNRSISQSANQSISQTLNQQSFSQSVNQSVSQSINKSINQSVIQSTEHGSSISYRFFTGVTHKDWFWVKHDGDWLNAVKQDSDEWSIPDLVIVGLVNWDSQTGSWDWSSHADYDARISGPNYHTFGNMTWQLHRLGQLLYDQYVVQNPDVRILLRDGQVWRTQLDHAVRRHTTERLHLLSQRIHQVMLQTRIGPYLELWNVNRLESYVSMDTRVRSASMCPNAHAMPRQVEIENQLLYNTICNY